MKIKAKLLWKDKDRKTHEDDCIIIGFLPDVFSTICIFKDGKLGTCSLYDLKITDENYLELLEVQNER